MLLPLVQCCEHMSHIFFFSSSHSLQAHFHKHKFDVKLKYWWIIKIDCKIKKHASRKNYYRKRGFNLSVQIFQLWMFIQLMQTQNTFAAKQLKHFFPFCFWKISTKSQNMLTSNALHCNHTFIGIMDLQMSSIEWIIFF